MSTYEISPKCIVSVIGCFIRNDSNECAKDKETTSQVAIGQEEKAEKKADQKKEGNFSWKHYCHTQ